MLKKIICVFLVLSITLFLVFSSSLGQNYLKEFLNSEIGQGILKSVVGGTVVKAFSTQINDIINTLTQNYGVPPHAATKVVPILIFGKGTQIGAAQVIGPTDEVNATQAVIKITVRFGEDRKFHGEVYIPSTTTNPFKFSRAYGVGVSAIVDINLSDF